MNATSLKTVTLPGVTVVGKIDLSKFTTKGGKRRKRSFRIRPATNVLGDFLKK